MGPVGADIDFMRRALNEAKRALREGEVPVGAVLVIHNEVIATAHNRKESVFDPTAHAEILALRRGSRKIKRWRLSDATLYVTKEPCVMCAGAMVNARLGRLVYGCRDAKGGAVQSLYQLLSDARLNHRVEVLQGLLEDDCALMLRSFFGARRGKTVTT